MKLKGRLAFALPWRAGRRPTQVDLRGLFAHRMACAQVESGAGRERADTNGRASLRLTEHPFTKRSGDFGQPHTSHTHFDDYFLAHTHVVDV